jgi:arsenite methyltransferase
VVAGAGVSVIGRVVIWDIDWSTLSWHSSDTERMRRIVRAWDRHYR